MRTPGLKWINTSTFHNMHHSQFSGNYGLMFRLWDRLLGTELPGYEAKFVQRGAVQQDASVKSAA
jgi:sterol desaturase/sphingolipid hydroxylase (fatty acid hydroxylase superfamily)